MTNEADVTQVIEADGDGGEGAAEAVDAAPPVDQYADEARKFGWAPIEDWRGDPEKHISAEKYMTRGAGALKKLESENVELRKQTETVAQRIERMERAQKTAYEAQLRAKEEELEEVKRRAVDTGNVKAYEEASRKQKELTKPELPELPELPPEDQLAIRGWLDAHPEYRTDTKYQAEINKLWSKAEELGIKDAQFILKYIDKNHDPAPAAKAPGVESGTPLRTGRQAKGWMSIPAEDRKQAAAFIEQGLFDAIAKEKKITPQEAYALAYFEE